MQCIYSPQICGVIEKQAEKRISQNEINASHFSLYQKDKIKDWNMS
jgi:hypothetical protein